MVVNWDASNKVKADSQHCKVEKQKCQPIDKIRVWKSKGCLLISRRMTGA